jgi:hypothetical protein
MHSSVRLVLTAVYLYSLVATVSYFHPGWLDAFRAEINYFIKMRSQAQDLDERLDAILAREKEKQETAWELIAGRLTLREAGIRFRELSEGEPALGWVGFRRPPLPAPSEEERHCRKAIEFVYALMRDNQVADADRVFARLKAELEEQFGPDSSRGLAVMDRDRRGPWHPGPWRFGPGEGRRFGGRPWRSTH